MHIRLQKHHTNAVVRSLLTLALAFGLAVVGTAPPASATGSSYRKPGFCARVTLPVALAEGMPRDQRISANYCQPFKWASGTHQVDVLTSGAGYISAYWDWQVKPSLYSYVDKTLDAGRATVTYDRLGSGLSSHPISTEVTLDRDAYVLHQIIQVVRLGGYGFKQVNSQGHSYGAGVVIQEAAKYKDVSRLIVNGYLHDPRDPAVGTRNYPANQDPQFAGAGLDDGYLTSRPNTRYLSFYSTNADPAVIAHDEATKDIISRTAFLGYAAQQGTPAATNPSATITVPVMAIVGQKDAIFCVNPAVLDCTNVAAVQAYEAPFYAAAKNFKAYSVANTGHDITLHPSANDSFKTINNWVKTH